VNVKRLENNMERTENMKKMAMMVGMVLLLGVGIALAADPAAGAAVVKKQTMCPVMTNNTVNPKLYVDSDGKRIYVCCRGCIGAVKKDPAKYIKQLEAEGITFDKAEPEKAK